MSEAQYNREELVRLRNQVDAKNAEIKMLRNYVGNNYLRSDYQNADQMRSEITSLREQVATYKALYEQQNDTGNKLADRIVDELENIRKLRDAVRVLGKAFIEVRKQRTYEFENDIVPGGAVSLSMEQACRNVMNNPIAAAAVKGNQ